MLSIFPTGGAYQVTVRYCLKILYLYNQSQQSDFIFIFQREREGERESTKARSTINTLEVIEDETRRV